MLIKNRLTSIILLSATLIPLFAQANNTDEGGGFGGGNGGDVFVDRFTTTARNLNQVFSEIRAKEPSFCPQSVAFADAVQETTVRSVPYVIINGYEHDARNFQERKLIEISRKRQIEIADDLGLLTILLHEYLGVKGIEGTNDTQYSSACIQGVIQRGYRAGEIVSPIETGKSFMASLAAGAFELRCEDESQTVSTSFSFREGSFVLQTKSNQSSAEKSLPLMVGYAQKMLGANEFLDMFESTIDVANAELKVRFSTLGKTPNGEELYFPPSLEMNLETKDLTNWRMELLGTRSIQYATGGAIREQKTTFTCVPTQITVSGHTH